VRDSGMADSESMGTASVSLDMAMEAAIQVRTAAHLANGCLVDRLIGCLHDWDGHRLPAVE